MAQWFNLNVWREEQRRIHAAELNLPSDQRTSYTNPFETAFPHVVNPSRMGDHLFDDAILPWCVEQFGVGGRTLYRELDDSERGEHMVDFDAPWAYYAGLLYFKNADDALFCKIRWM